jgi:hypothetical protein
MTSGALAITRGPDTTKPRLGNWLPSQGWCSRDGGIRTRDPLNPIQVRYRAALRPVDRTRNLTGQPVISYFAFAAHSRHEGWM